MQFVGGWRLESSGQRVLGLWLTSNVRSAKAEFIAHLDDLAIAEVNLDKL